MPGFCHSYYAIFCIYLFSPNFICLFVRSTVIVGNRDSFMVTHKQQFSGCTWEVYRVQGQYYLMEMGPKYRIAVRKLGYTYSGYLRGTPSVCLTFCLLNYTLYPCGPFSFSDWLLLLLILCVSCDGWPRLDSMLPFVSSTAIITLISQSPNSVSQILPRIH